ncbi:hypothetical protein [Janthinobacterium agaricidamnosum]|uniref:hypothetical protein n=1 Tax=Janthinobacterium agaricidamnosum TaxID=55508 RepID=UPI0011860120|nr:hypothetical protein [Janthinobacterium agaricidamnosum]
MMQDLVRLCAGPAVDSAEAAAGEAIEKTLPQGGMASRFRWVMRLATKNGSDSSRNIAGEIFPVYNFYRCGG